MVVLEGTALTKTYREGRVETPVLQGISLELHRGEIVALEGPSGSGKTTLLQILGCILTASSGAVEVAGKQVTASTNLAEIRKRNFGFVFQQFNLIRGISVLENVMLPAYPLGRPYGKLQEKAWGLLDLLHLAHRGEARAEWLSGGEAQRAAIARALINDPEVVIADEPTANLDTTLSREFLGYLEILKQQGKTILLTSHDPLVYESSMVDRVVGLRDGRVVEGG